MDKNGDGLITYEEVLNFGMNVNKSLLSLAEVQFKLPVESWTGTAE